MMMGFKSREITNLLVLDLPCNEEIIVSLHLIYVQLKLELRHLPPALISVESLKCERA